MAFYTVMRLHLNKSVNYDTITTTYLYGLLLHIYGIFLAGLANGSFQYKHSIDSWYKSECFTFQIFFLITLPAHQCSWLPLTDRSSPITDHRTLIIDHSFSLTNLRLLTCLFGIPFHFFIVSDESQLFSHKSNQPSSTDLLYYWSIARIAAPSVDDRSFDRTYALINILMSF